MRPLVRKHFVTARVAGVRSVWVASPKPQPITIAAAAIAGAKGLGAESAELITYATSYDKSPGDSIVGYVGIVF